MLDLPKPYNGIHPRSINSIVVKDNGVVKTNVPISVIQIPNRDLQGYDSLIPSVAIVVPVFISASVSIGITLWS